MDGTGAGLGFDVVTYILNFDVAGSGRGGNGRGAGKGDVVLNIDVAVEIFIVAVANGDVVAVLNDGRIGDDLLNSGFDVTAAFAVVVSVDAGGDVDLIVGAGVQVDGA